MRRQHQDTTTTLLHSSSSSSIALLQERFRQLQRVKEMREEKELQKVGLGLTTSPSPSPSPSPDPHPAARPLWICHPDLIRPISADPGSVSISTSAAVVGARYLGINSVNFAAEGSTSGYGSATGSVSRCSGSSSIQNLKTCSDPHDVDTSLHL